MLITDLSTLIAASKTGQDLTWKKTATRVSIANRPFSVFDLAGIPGAGTLNVGNTANGLVPTDATAGYPTIRNFTPSSSGYVGIARISNTVTCNIAVYDRLFVCGAYSFNSNIALASQPSYASRIPSSDYSGTEIWCETVAAPTGNLAVNVGYTNENGTSGRSTGAQGIGAAPTVGRCWQLNLQNGDQGVQRIDSVACSVATAGASCVNVMVLRKLFETTIQNANQIIPFRVDDILLPRIYEDSALYALVSAVSTSTGNPSFFAKIVQG